VTLMLKVLSIRLQNVEAFREDAQEIESLQRTLLEIVGGMDRLMQAERLRSEQTKPQLRLVDLRRVAEDVVSQHARRAAEKKLVIELHVPSDAAAITDRELLMLILQNLVGNAVKFSAAGAIHLSAHAGGEDDWEISVSDQGPGIPPEHLEHIFKAFTRGGTYGEDGVGLGLTSASRAAQALGAKLTVESTPRLGSVFRVHLPHGQAATDPKAKDRAT
jgi:signal transduction histidine kinase